MNSVAVGGERIIRPKHADELKTERCRAEEVELDFYLQSSYELRLYRTARGGRRAPTFSGMKMGGECDKKY